MATTDARVDQYIMKSAEYARPILEHFRALVHKAVPEVTETIKWGMPHFEYQGVLCHMAAFKQHCAFGFWNAAAMKDPEKIFIAHGESAMGHFGKIASIKDLPSNKVITAYIKEAAKLNEAGVKRPAAKKASQQKDIEVPADLVKALNKVKAAKKTFDAFSYSNKKEYVQWITEAKTEDTRNKRIATAVEWMAEGKGRNWKYEKKA